ncbi:tetratricopeptide repeat protein [Castellaniella sp. MT123]|uniref:tetratricopeptide repeat protein n=1 Tax=Castellaniella sp. MT123 TaxID=3140381 RepID=UPI0031F39544
MIRVFLTVLTLCAGLAAGPATGASHDTNASGAALQDLNFNPKTGEFTLPEAPDGGWKAFADLLQKATPSVNTAIPLTPSQVTDHIAAMIDAGQAREALDVIQKRETARAASAPVGTDVQLEYQKGRALAALGEHDQAIALWQRMTEAFPELPEPWNALAIEYAGQGKLQMAHDALNMALASDPSFAPALENLGHVQMALAQESFARARAAQTHPATIVPATPEPLQNQPGKRPLPTAPATMR